MAENNLSTQHTLFRIVSLRNPEKANKENQEKRFVLYFDGQNELQKRGQFYTAVMSKAPTQTKWQALSEKAIAFKNSAFTSEKDIEKLIKSFFSLKLLIGQISDGGCFFSVACDEADDADFLPEFDDFTDKNIKIYGNSNYSRIQSLRTHPDLLVKGFGSILNSFITASEDWKDLSGWIYYDTKTKEQVITKKDLWISSYDKKKPFELIFRKKQLSKQQSDKEKYAQMYFSKKVKKEYIQRVKIEGYEKWKKGVEAVYPEFK